MKKVVLGVLAIFMASSLSAQINVGANFLVGIPSGNWNTNPQSVSTAFGGGLEVNYSLFDKLSVGLEFGYSSFGEFEESLFTVTQMPITVKAEYYFMDGGLKPFVGLGVGYYLIDYNIDGDKFVDVNGIGISPRIGATYEVSDLVDLVLNVNYNLLFGQKADGEGEVIDEATTSIGIGVGARFNLTD